MQKQASNLDLITYQNAIMNSSAKPIEPIRSGLVDGRVASHYVALLSMFVDVTAPRLWYLASHLWTISYSNSLKACLAYGQFTVWLFVYRNFRSPNASLGPTFRTRQCRQTCSKFVLSLMVRQLYTV